MKICWDNLEGVSLNRMGNFKKGTSVYVYKEVCVKCGESYLTKKSNQSNFCSFSCANKDKPLSNEHKKKLSILRMGRTHSMETKKKISESLKGLLSGKKNGMYGRAHTGETRKLMVIKGKENMLKRIKNCDTPTVRGKDHPNWKGGVARKKLPLFDTYAHQIEYVHEVRPVVRGGIKLLEVRCKNCNNWFVPKTNDVRSRLGSLVGRKDGENNFYCSNECKNSCNIFNQQKWPKNHKPRKTNKSIWYTNAELRIWREEVLKRADYKCEYCGEKATIAHHSKPKKLEPFLALDPEYGVACCEKCHYKYGHNGECSTGHLAHIDCK